MITQVPCAHLGGPFAILSLVASFGRARRVALCEVARLDAFGSGQTVSFEAPISVFLKL